MVFDDGIDPLTACRIEREYEACVIDDAYEVLVADQASRSFMQVLAAYPEGSAVVVQLARAETLRGNLQEPLAGWVSLEWAGRRTFIAPRAIARIQVVETPRRKSSPSSVRTLGSVLREHQYASRTVRLRLTDGSAVCSHLCTVGADFVRMGDGSLVPVASIDVCELL